MFNRNKNISEGEKIAHINGKYGLVNTAIKSIIKALSVALGSSAVTTITITLIINYTNYVSPRGEELLSQQSTMIEDLQNQCASLEAQNQNLQISYEAVLAELESISDSQTQFSNPSSAVPLQTTETITKLTALPLLGNNNDYYNHVYNTAENKDSARSSLGDVFNSSISMGADGDIDYFLGNAYQTLSFTLCISESTKNIDDHSSSITIYSVEGNGENESLTPIYSSPFLTMGFIPEVIGPIDVTGVEHLRISFYGDGKINGMPRIILGNPELT